MKIILSRKGFDSANGGIASPIFEDGTMLSFPIPTRIVNDDEINGALRYDALEYNGISLDKILLDLGYKGSEYCHLDPDIVRERRKDPVSEYEWKAAFGQINQAASYLVNKKISKGDLFLFFGNFNHVKAVDGKYEYLHCSKSCIDDMYYGRQIQVIWGYLQIEKVVDDPEEFPNYSWHPHSHVSYVKGEKNNRIFVATDHLSFAPWLPGYGVFKYNEKRVLSMPGKPKATWKYNKAYGTENILCNRKNSAKNGEGLYYAGIWQEMVLKENELSENWAKSMIL